MSNHSTLSPLLESIVQDNTTYKFPMECINKELINMFVEKDEFDYFMMQSYKKLKREYGSTIAHIFITHLELKLDIHKIDIHNLSLQEYQDKIEYLITSLENLHITRIDKNSPDGQLMSAME
jgi:hypothetical protein